MDIKKQ